MNLNARPLNFNAGSLKKIGTTYEMRWIKQSNVMDKPMNFNGVRHEFHWLIENQVYVLYRYRKSNQSESLASSASSVLVLASSPNSKSANVIQMWSVEWSMMPQCPRVPTRPTAALML
jgi:hypothetical protein